MFLFFIQVNLWVKLLSPVWEEENQLDATQCFIELVICSTCFGHI